MGISDDQFVDLIQKGDQGAMQVLFQQHSSRIYALALRMTGSVADAEDVVQETFLRAFRFSRKFRGESTLGTWLYRIALNRTRDLCKKKSRRHLREGGQSNVEPTTQPVDIITRKKLEQALSQLPTGYREVLVMHDVLGMDHNEIAAVLQVEAGTSKSQLHKGRARMRKLLRSI